MRARNGLLRHPKLYALLAGVLVTLAAATIFAAAGVHSSPVVEPITASEQAQAEKLAIAYANIASSDGKGSDGTTWPDSVVSFHVVASSRGAAAAFAGSQSDSDSRVIVAAIAGDFTLIAPGPPGSEYPSGHQLVIVIDPATDSVTDVGVSGEVRDLKALGDPVSLR